MEFSHVSVLLPQSIEGLNIKKTGTYVDGTCGGGGHSLAIAKNLDGGRLICIDRDQEAINASQKILKNYNNVTFVHDNYKNLDIILKDNLIDSIDGLLIDLGVSSYQLDNKERGFSYMSDAPLDMRMDQTEGTTAADILASYSGEELKKIFYEYGQEKFSGKIADAIVKKRDKSPILTTGELNKIIAECVPKNQPGGHPSKRIFQALRIEVNEELKGLYDYIYSLPDLLKPGGRICIITFHSLEDKIVKDAFRKANNPCICPKEFPVCACGRKSKGRIITRKPILPTQEEVAVNKRSKSAKLRIFEKV